jgi:hypothetical protein
MRCRGADGLVQGAYPRTRRDAEASGDPAGTAEDGGGQGVQARPQARAITRVYDAALAEAGIAARVRDVRRTRSSASWRIWRRRARWMRRRFPRRWASSPGPGCWRIGEARAIIRPNDRWRTAVSVETLTNTGAAAVSERHALLEPPAGPAKGAALAGLIDRLGFVQVDSVNTLARAHDLILWSRRPTYRPASLRWVNDRARATFEHWTHDASIMPDGFLPPLAPAFRARPGPAARALEGLARRSVPWELDRILAHVSDTARCRAASSQAKGPRNQRAGGIGTRRKPRWSTCGAPAIWPSPGARGFASSMT